jgi:hypothetical protein
MVSIWLVANDVKSLQFATLALLSLAKVIDDVFDFTVSPIQLGCLQDHSS